MGNPTPDKDGPAGTREELKALWSAIRDLQRPSGTSLTSLVAQVQQALANITSTVTNAISTLSYTKAQTDSKVASPGAIAPTTVTASGVVQGSAGTFPGGLSSTDVYSHLVTGGGAYRATWTHESGFLGYAPSSRRFKTDIEQFSIDLEKIDDLMLHRFHYLAAVPYSQEAQPWSVGLIAEEVHALGLTWLVDYDDAGQPFGVRYELLALALIPALQRANKRLASRGFREQTMTVAGFTLVTGYRDVDVKWATPFVDADYQVQVSAIPPGGALVAVSAAPIPGTRTPEGVRVRVSTNGIVLGAGTQVTATGMHL